MSVRPNLVLAICCLSLLLVGMDLTIVNVALPAIKSDFHAAMSDLQWVIDAYTLTIASFLILAGSMADRYGRRRVFQLGMVCFTLGSVLCSLAHSIGALIAFRVFQALGGSMLNPVALSIISNVITNPKERARAVGIWGAVAGLALAIGPVLGGILTQNVGWRSVFWINLPIGVAAIALAAKYVPESKAERARRVDPVGQVLVLTGLCALTYAVIEGPRAGWGSLTILGLFALAVAAVVALVVFEPRQQEPLLDLRFWRSIPFSSATAIAALAFASFAGFLFLNTLYLQQTRGLSAFHTGLCTLPLAVMMMICAPISGRLVGSHGARFPLLAAGTALALATLALTQLEADTPLPLLLGTYIVFGIGMGLVNPPITNTAVSGLPQSQAGVAAAIASTSRQVGASMGVAVAGTVAATATGSFVQATHVIWWLMTLAGISILVLGWVSTSAWGKESVKRLSGLLQD